MEINESHKTQDRTSLCAVNELDLYTAVSIRRLLVTVRQRDTAPYRIPHYARRAVVKIKKKLVIIIIIRFVKRQNVKRLPWR